MNACATCEGSMEQDGQWPTDDGREQCHDCFEREADASWWDAMIALSGAIVSGDGT